LLEWAGVVNELSSLEDKREITPLNQKNRFCQSKKATLEPHFQSLANYFKNFFREILNYAKNEPEISS